MGRISELLRIGMFGLRGLRPDLEISGFETAFSEIAPGLAARGHRITIYCRASSHSTGARVPGPEGVELIYIPSPGGKNLSAVISTFLAVLHAFVFRRFDLWFFVNVGMGHHAALARLSRKPVVMNVDGLDWTRAKWGPLARAYFRSAANSAVYFCSRLITDAYGMQTYYRKHFDVDSSMIPYGADIERSETPELITPFGVVPRSYYLIVSRLIPENSLVAMLDGFRRSRTTRKLIVVGSANYTSAFHRELKQIADSDPRIVLVGHVHDQALLKELWCNCYAYLHGHSVGGTNPALLRAMGYGCAILARDTTFNREVLVETGLYFSDASTATDRLEQLDNNAGLVTQLRVLANARVAERYSWPRIVNEYEELFTHVVAHHRFERELTALVQ